jgi:hypothetical protein
LHAHPQITNYTNEQQQPETKSTAAFQRDAILTLLAEKTCEELNWGM